MARRRSHLGPVLAGIVVIVAGFAIAAVEMLRRPRGSIWGVVAVAVALVVLIRAVTRPR